MRVLLKHIFRLGWVQSDSYTDIRLQLDYMIFLYTLIDSIRPGRVEAGRIWVGEFERVIFEHP